MNSQDWKDLVRGVAPMLGAALGGPLAGGVVKVLADKVLGGSSEDPVADEAKLAGLLSNGLTPELQARIVEAQQAFKLAALQAGLREKELDVQVETAAIADTANARTVWHEKDWVVGLGILINVLSYATVAALLVGCYKLATGTAVSTLEPGIAAMLGGLVGSAVQWILSNAQQANGFFFGSNPTSRRMAKDLGGAVEGMARSAASGNQSQATRK